MKGNIKKLAVGATIAAIAMFMAVATASAWWMNGLWGEYEVIGTGQCLFSLNGIDPTLKPNPGFTQIATTYYDGVYKFEHNGHGSASLTGRQVSAAGGSVSTLKFDFTYSVHHGGITFTTIRGSDTSTCDKGVCTPGTTYLSSGPLQGSISPFGDTLLVYCGAPAVIDILKPDLSPAGPQLICNINLSGFRK